MKNLRHLLKDSKAAQVAPPIMSAGLTAEIVFVPESDALLPPVFKGRSRKIKEGIKAFPVVNVPGGAAIVAGTYGEGRFFLSSDISLFAPLRIEHGDNAPLLLNTLEWLTGRSLPPGQRKEFLTKRFLSEADFHPIREEDGNLK